MRSRVGQRLLVVTYGLEVPKPYVCFRLWWERVERLGNSLGIPPLKVYGWFKERPHRIKDGSSHLLSRSRKRFEEQAQKDNVLSLGLERLTQPGGYCAFDWEFTAECGEGAGVNGLSYVGIDLEFARFNSDGCRSVSAFVNEVVKIGCEFAEVAYGLGFIMPWKFMAPGYAIGLGCGGADKELIHDANEWSMSASKQCGAILRNVFGYNLLNERHLDINVGGQRLEEWIRADSSRGRLEPLEGGLIQWTFQDGDDESAFLHWDYPPVVKVREELKKYNIFPWQRLLEQ